MTLKRDIRDEAQKRRNTIECGRKRQVSRLHLKRCGRLFDWERIFSGRRIKERSALDNPRADVYNKDKERRCPCKRLAPHRHMVKKNDRHRFGDCGRSFLFVVIAIIVRDPPCNVKGDMHDLNQQHQ
jgi:hypothetical protein